MSTPDRYSLWLVPKGDAGDKLQSLVDKLADNYAAPRFVPHMTLVANIFVDSEQARASLDQRITELASSIGKFSITLSTFDYTDEEFRCLFLLAEKTEELDAVYARATESFPQVADEHFRALPHMSVLYGNFDSVTKETIIEQNDISDITFDVESFDLFLTNSPIESWELSHEFPLSEQ